MKSTIRLILTILIVSGIYETVNAQQLKLFKNFEVKLLDFGSEYYVVSKLGDDKECCNSRRMLGTVEASTKDSIRMTVKSMETIRVDSEKSYHSEVKFNTKLEFPVYTMAKTDIKSIAKKNSGFKDVLMVSGVTLFITSVATAIHGVIVEEEDRKTMFVSAGIQLGTSIALISIGNRKNKKYKVANNAWQFQ